MKSPFVKSDLNLSNLLKKKIVMRIKHIDKDACIQIDFSDGSFIVLSAMPDKEFSAIPLVHFYDVSGEPIQYMV